MGIYKDNNPTVGIYYRQTPILSVYVGANKVWPNNDTIDTILSCYAAGYWMDEYPWTEDTAWVD